VASASNFVGLLQDGQSVLKYPHRKTTETMLCLREEADRYIRLGPHPNLVTYRGFTEDGLVLEFCQKGGLNAAIRSKIPNELTEERKTVISRQITLGLIHLHNQNFVHCDVHTRNIFLTSDTTAKIGDLQGQLYQPDGSIEMETMSQESSKSRHTDAGDEESSYRTDVFALGTLLYQLWYGDLPFPELDEYKYEDLIKARYREKDYPFDPEHATGIDVIIGNCWSSKYKHTSEILDDMDDCLRKRHCLDPSYNV
jgi:serine/threonine protein kinase